MQPLNKKDKIKSLISDMLNQSHKAMMNKIDKALTCGAIDIENWHEDYNPMILPKCIVIAIMQNESNQYDGRGTSFEKKIKKEVSNIRYHLDTSF